MFRSLADLQRLPTGQFEMDPAIIGDIPADWETVQYVLGVIPDPLDPTKPIAAWVPISLAGLTGGYGIYGTYG